MVNATEMYSKLAERFSAAGSASFVKILEAMTTLEEANLMLSLPATCQQLAAKFSLDEAGLAARLEDMVSRGLILRGAEGGYANHKNITSLHHAALGLVPPEMRPRIYPLWSKFFYTDWRKILVDNWELRLDTRGWSTHRVVPARKALMASQNIQPEQVLWYEDMVEILKRAKRILIGPCGCRIAWGQCDSPLEVCLHLDYEGHHNKRASQIELSFEEALTRMDAAEEVGLVHVPLNTTQGDHFCNCCDDCCMVLNSLIHYGKVHKILAPSRYRAVIDEERCSGCQICIERCKFDVIEMRKPEGSKKMKAYIIDEHCMGCGLCIFKCARKAMALELVRPPEHIPTVPKFEVTVVRRGSEKEA
ncbi:MAG: 4Fe-4S binding protein [Chloroflexi bacterium]|nr:4Fe-4S binding protein [Chloroflexota bacterium]